MSSGGIMLERYIDRFRGEHCCIDMSLLSREQHTYFKSEMHFVDSLRFLQVHIAAACCLEKFLQVPKTSFLAVSLLFYNYFGKTDSDNPYINF